jgi:protein-tyrosine phosphatase
MDSLGDGASMGLTARIEPTFQIVLICTGNRFRSPIAEGLLRKLGEGLPLELVSFGTREVGPLPPLTEAFEAAARYGLDLDRHRACSLRGEDLRSSDLILGFEHLHIATAVVDAGAPRERSFTLPGFVDVLPSIPAPSRLGTVAGAREVVAAAARMQAAGTGGSRPAEMPDPLDGPPEGYVESATRLQELCVRLLAGLFGRSDSELSGVDALAGKFRRRRS